MSITPVFRLRPRNQKAQEALQGVLDLGDWSEPVRLALNKRLTGLLPDGVGTQWSYVMVNSDEANMQAFLKAVGEGPRPFSTLAVWNGLLPFVRRDTLELLCGQRRLAQTAGVSLGDVSRALARLVEMGCLLQEGKGRYRANPAFIWRGELAKREKAQAEAPKLRLIPTAQPERNARTAARSAPAPTPS